MNTQFNSKVVSEVRRMYREDPRYQALFDWLAGRKRDASETSVDRIAYKLDIHRGEAVAMVKRLAEEDCGEFIVGRRGQQSRFRWAYSCISLGKAAAGEDEELEAPEDPVAEDQDEEVISEGLTVGPLTIPAAKASLAAALGVSEGNIEIIIRA